MHLNGVMGERFEANVQQWLLCAPYANPGMIQMYFRRNAQRQGMVPWYGEFSGKYLTSVALAYAMEPGERIRQAGDYIVSQLAAAQDTDGYLGVWPDSDKLAGRAHNGTKTWDAWSHYHNMLGLRWWHQYTGSEEAKRVLLRAADCLYDFFITHAHPLDEDKDGTDTVIGHIFALLYQDEGDERYLQVVRRCFEAFEAPQGGDYYRSGLENTPFYRMKRKRWECLHAIEAIKEMAKLTGDARYRTAFENIWTGIARYDRHNTGGFSSGESACGDPYDTRAIETCCTIAWMALTQDMLDLTQDSRAADELELSTWNAMLGAQQASGRYFAYNAPMIGDKKASAHEIGFQAIAGSPELNCCAVNAPRGFGMIGQWGLTGNEAGVTVNYYGASRGSVRLKQGTIEVTQTGDYPLGDTITLRVAMPESMRIPVRLRIPFWSERTAVFLNGKAQDGVRAGAYFTLEDVGNGDEIRLRMDMSLHFWQGDRELSGKTALYYGPILLACDQRFEKDAMGNLPRLQLPTLQAERAQGGDTLWPQANLLLRVKDANGTQLLLCDFASAGQTGTSYTTWLPTEEGLRPLQPQDALQPWGRRL